jgi:hypothetical protein
MKLSRALLALLCGSVAPLLAQDGAPPVPPDAVAVRLTEAQLDQLLGPIALYPDAIIALILPASTVPADVVLAARQMRGSNNDRSQVEQRAWDESVKSLTFYPDALKWMDDNLEWTRQLGEAFLAQPADVMNAIQRLRAKARAAGTLVDSVQQQVLVTPDAIRIVPAQPDVIYVPQYDPGVVFVDQPAFYPLPPLAFGAGIRVGSWLAYDCDWAHRKIWMGDRHRRWQAHDWQRPVVAPDRFSPGGTLVHHWQPAATALQRTSIVRTLTRPAPRGVPATVPPIERTRGPRTGRDFPGRREIATAPLPPPTTPRPENWRSHERSLPTVVGREQFSAAPALPATAPALPTARRSHTFVGPTVPPAALHVAPPLPAVAPPLPATVPTFSSPPAPAPSSPPAAPERRAPVNHRTGRRANQD